MRRTRPFSRIPGPGNGSLLAVTVDTLVSGIHFPPGTGPSAVAFKSLAVNLSDLAAMGAEPVAGQAVCESPPGDGGWCEAVASSMGDVARDAFHFTVSVRCCDGPVRRVTVQAMGRVPGALVLTRSGASAGDHVWVSGTTGDAGGGLATAQGRLDAGDDANFLRQRLDRPAPRIELGVALRGIASAAIDVSDGVAGDAGHIARGSRVALHLEQERLPLSPALLRAAGEGAARRFAAFAGDDYELLFTAPAHRDAAVTAAARGVAIPVRRIGEVRPGTGARMVDSRGQEVTGTAFEHFQPVEPPP